jgi:uncharacterized protein (TIGR00106 family)
MSKPDNSRIMAEFSLSPVDKGQSVSPYIAACQDVLREKGIEHEMHAMGTNLIGTWDETMSAINACRLKVIEMGAERVSININVDSRQNITPSFTHKVRSVREKMS